MSVGGLDHRVTVGLCIQRAVGCAVPQGCVRLGLQGRAHRGGVGGVGCGVQQDLSGGGRVAEGGVSGQVGWRTRWSVRWGQSGSVRGRLYRGVGCRIRGKVGGSECGWIGECVRERVRGRVGLSWPGCVCRGRLLWICANYLPLGHIPHLIVPVQQLQGTTTHTNGKEEQRRIQQDVSTDFLRWHNPLNWLLSL